MPLKRMRYSHFGCNVVHEDICFPNSTDVEKVKMEIKAEIESEEANYQLSMGMGQSTKPRGYTGTVATNGQVKYHESGCRWYQLL